MWPLRGPLLLGVFTLAVSARPVAQATYPFRDPAIPVEDRVTNLLSLMTLEEKLACLATTTAVPRLGIPEAGSSEGLHGLVRKAAVNTPAIPTTSFGQVVGMGATWDRDLILRAGAVEG
jgi:beta-glucosidase